MFALISHFPRTGKTSIWQIYVRILDLTFDALELQSRHSLTHERERERGVVIVLHLRVRRRAPCAIRPARSQWVVYLM